MCWRRLSSRTKVQVLFYFITEFIIIFKHTLRFLLIAVTVITLQLDSSSTRMATCLSARPLHGAVLLYHDDVTSDSSIVVPTEPSKNTGQGPLTGAASHQAAAERALYADYESFSSVENATRSVLSRKEAPIRFEAPYLHGAVN